MNRSSFGCAVTRAAGRDEWVGVGIFDSGLRACPCGASDPYDACCGALHRGERLPLTAEELMRSRYTAYVVSDEPYLFRTWHPKRRPAEITTGGDVTWTGLTVHRSEGGDEDDAEGTVEFTASYIGVDGVERTIHEVSRFSRRGGRWVYSHAVE